MTERARGVGSGVAPLERPDRRFNPSQALSVRLARLGLAPEAEQATKQSKFGPSKLWPPTKHTHTRYSAYDVSIPNPLAADSDGAPDEEATPGTIKGSGDRVKGQES